MNKDKSSDGCHFYKTSDLEKLKKLEDNSVVLDRIMKEKSNLPFMN